MKWSFLHLKQTVVAIPQQKCKCHNSLSCLSIHYSMAMMSQAFHKSTYCLLRHGIPLFLKNCPQVTEVLGCRVSTLCTTTQLIPYVFYWIQVCRKCRPLCLRYPSLQQPFPDDVTSMSLGIDVHEDEIRPVLLMQRHDDSIIDVTKYCHSTIHKV